MHSRWFNAAVIILWLATMSWLVKAKVLPLLLVGEPPNYARIIAAQKHELPVGWIISFNDRTLGWALSDTATQPNGMTDIHGRVHFDSLPLNEVMPGWLKALSRLIEHPVGNLQLDARSVLTINALGQLTRFDSTMRMPPLEDIVSVRGAVDGQQLDIIVRSGPISFPTQAYLPSDALLSDAFSPQIQLPGLRLGQEWTVPVYSPLWPAKSPLKIIHAKVERLEPILWDGTMEDVWLVEYRDDPGAGGSQLPQGKIWVRRDGAVIKQQVMLIDSMVTFTRASDSESQRMVGAAGPNWWTPESDTPMEFRGNWRSADVPPEEASTQPGRSL